MVKISVYIYIHGIKIILKFRWESGFLKGVPWNPLMHYNGSAGYLLHLSVNKTANDFITINQFFHPHANLC